ncbi:Dephospho-CoA kinase [hydrothermal vent metagenome]|uniref:Dephospho-CoA kinase n=1 Tax=hydrothermal vent metagenome TaxID=652676 RepID=A0A3B0UG71_9ZZZZ
MSIKLGLTGSIGMGKSTTARFFRDFGVPVWDADAEVHRFYESGGAALAPIGALVPEATKEGFVDRNVLKDKIAIDNSLLGKIESAVRPLLANSRQDFHTRNKESAVMVFDIPVLYETDAESWMDYVLVVTAPEEVQRHRVLMRGSMSEDLFATIIARQMPDIEKRALADYIFDTSLGLEHTKAEVKALIEELEQEDA